MDALQRWALALLFVRVIALIVSTTHWAQWVATLLTIGDQRKAWVRSSVSFDAIWQKVNLLQTDTDWKGNDGMDQVCRRSRVSTVQCTGGSKKQEYVECRWVREQWPSGLRKVMCSVHCIRWRFPSIWLAKLQILVRKKPQKWHDTCLHCSLSFQCDNPSLCISGIYRTWSFHGETESFSVVSSTVLNKS